MLKCKCSATADLVHLVFNLMRVILYVSSLTHYSNSANCSLNSDVMWMYFVLERHFTISKQTKIECMCFSHVGVLFEKLSFPESRKIRHLETVFNICT